MDGDHETHGLWQQGPRARKGLFRFVSPGALVVALLVPLVLLLLQGSWHGDLRRLLVSRYLQNFVVAACIGGCISGLYRFVWPRLIKRRPSPLLWAVVHGSTVLVGVVGGGEVAARLVAFVWALPLDHVRQTVLRLGLFVSTSVVATLIVYDRLRAQARRLQIREQQARLATTQAELRALQARTNPHFLFNSLNSVAGLIAEDPVRAELMLEKLSLVFRYALDGSRRETVSLGAEIAAVSTYLDVEAIRFGERLTVELDVDRDPRVQELLVPPLLLQPLVENAILHGIAPNRDRGTVSLTVARRDGSVRITVQDDGAGAPAEPTGSGSALRDLGERLRLLYDSRATLDHGPRQPRGYRAEVVLPLESRP
jgi:two-component system sensor histidine kinase AlgZ